MIDLPKDKQLILFDGICNFCNKSILMIIKHDTENKFIFASLQSDIGKEIIANLAIDTLKIDSIILYKPGIAYYIKSTAAIKIMNQFNGLWIISYLLWIFPEVIRNVVYDFIAKNRYKWFGKKAQCMIPTKEIRAKFLS
ncbi:thiol-disulfide oxidoreductase DCC family protein [Tenacibaculum retecalamus]|uniref:thiol-disulfide oxidoreductase DCC family protein n=1 Tax=Tenacibaculum retecalamus TaxID=3018315 RepID=UPI0023D914DE|nr:DCC1-like thiol-disulfide oxidoreductase family protein [Tenacibaculum retecalamus]WBX70119.1 DCC1-like thiol-disulfide oxidoreductase family protein [Tenacibaculum retecalamus]